MNANKFWSLALALTAGVYLLPAAARAFDGSAPLLCAAAHSIHCQVGQSCVVGPPENINIPSFIRIDFDAMTIVPKGEDDPDHATKIGAVSNDGDTLILFGDDGGLAWSMTISDSGKMVISAGRDQEGFILFGVCTPD